MLAVNDVQATSSHNYRTPDAEVDEVAVNPHNTVQLVRLCLYNGYSWQEHCRQENLVEQSSWLLLRPAGGNCWRRSA
jgi:hypothetical protein